MKGHQGYLEVHRSAHGALVGVVGGAREAGSAEGVATGRRDRLKQQLHAQYAVRLIAALRKPSGSARVPATTISITSCHLTALLLAPLI
jgi:hypothetical protein